ncbi:MAG TPA: TolC family protein, partial [Planctomycetota bacterium]|nr:TolC family protein [Planctomycetota bacterium]
PAPWGEAGPEGEEAPPLALSLAEARNLAVRNNVGLELEAVTAEAAEYVALGSWGAFDPVLDLAGTYEDIKQNPVTGFTAANEQNLLANAALAVPVTTGGTFVADYTRQTSETDNPFSTFPEFTSDAFSLSFNQPLLRGAWARSATAEQRANEVEAARAREQQKQQLQQLLLDVEIAYWDLVAALEELDVRRLAVELGQRQYDQNQERLRVGVGTEVDVLQAETNLSAQEQRFLLAANQRDAAMDALKELMFRRPAEDEGGFEGFLDAWARPIEPQTPLPGIPDPLPSTDWVASVERAIDARPEVARQLLAVDAAEILLRQAEQDRLPGLDVRLEMVGSGLGESRNAAFEDALTFDFPTYRGTLAFNQPLGNRTARYFELQARANLRAARLGYDQLENLLVAEVRNAAREVDYQARAVEAAQKSRRFAERQLQAESIRYEEGISTTFQVLEFQTQLAEALSAEKAALANHAKALAALRRAEGRIEEEPAP